MQQILANLGDLPTQGAADLMCGEKQRNGQNRNFKSAASVPVNMNSQNSFANAQKTVPAEYVPPMSLHRFCEITGLSKASVWRYEKRGWLPTHLIANRRHNLAADVADFNRRLASDEFAGSVSIFRQARSIKPKNERQ